MIIWESSGIKNEESAPQAPQKWGFGEDLGVFEPIFGQIFLTLKEWVGGGGVDSEN